MADKERFAYFEKRLEHTLLHTQQSTRLIYLVNGGILAALYFLTGKTVSGIDKTDVAIFFLFLLASTNLIHDWILLCFGIGLVHIDCFR